MQEYKLGQPHDIKEKEKVELEVINTEEKVDEPKSKKTTNKKKESN